jgi:hypothetical protein
LLLEDINDNIPVDQKRDLLNSISNYIITELGYKDYGPKGLYFYYGPTVQKEIYNASAIMSSFLIRTGEYLKDNRIIMYGEKGLLYILSKQNEDGSWFSNEDNEKSYIDNFHSLFIVNALLDCKNFTKISLSETINKAIIYIENKFLIVRNDRLIIRHFDIRFLPKNSSVIQKVDARDIASAIILYSKHNYSEDRLILLIKFLFQYFYKKDDGYFYCEKTWFWTNKIPYIEIQAWVIYSLSILVYKCNES